MLWDLEEDPAEYHDVSEDPDYRDALGACRHRLLQRLATVDAERQLEKTAAY